MARIRYLKPGFFKDEDISDLKFETRLLFEGLWNIADREGRLEDRPKRIKVEVFPYDDVDIEAGLVRLTLPKKISKKPFILRYLGSDGLPYIQILEWHKHQKPHHTEQASIIPAPTKEDLKRLSNGVLTVGQQEGMGMGNGDGKGNGEKKQPSAADAALKEIYETSKINVYQILNKFKKGLKAKKVTILGVDYRLPDDVILATCIGFKKYDGKIRKDYPWFLKVLGQELERWWVEKQDKEHQEIKSDLATSRGGDVQAVKDIIAMMMSKKGGVLS